MTEQGERLERLLVGGPLVLLALFLLYNVGLRVLLAFGVTTLLADLVGWVFPTPPLPTNPVRWTVLVLGTLPLLWVGERTLLGRGSRRTSRWATAWAIGLVIHTVGPFLTLLDWGRRYGYFEYLWTVPTQTEAALVSGVLVAVGGLASLWDWTPEQSEPHTGSATRTQDDRASTAREESPPSAERRSLLTTAVSVGVGITLLASAAIDLLFAPGNYSQSITPAAVFDFESRSDGQVMVTHSGGDWFLDENAASVTVAYTDGSGTQRTETWAGNPGEFSIKPGDTYTTSKPVKPGTTLRVIWTKAGGGKTQTVGSAEVDG